MQNIKLKMQNVKWPHPPKKAGLSTRFAFYILHFAFCISLCILHFPAVQVGFAKYRE